MERADRDGPVADDAGLPSALGMGTHVEVEPVVHLGRHPPATVARGRDAGQTRGRLSGRHQLRRGVGHGDPVPPHPPDGAVGDRPAKGRCAHSAVEDVAAVHDPATGSDPRVQIHPTRVSSRAGVRPGPPPLVHSGHARVAREEAPRSPGPPTSRERIRMIAPDSDARRPRLRIRSHSPNPVAACGGGVRWRRLDPRARTRAARPRWGRVYEVSPPVVLPRLREGGGRGCYRRISATTSPYSVSSTGVNPTRRKNASGPPSPAS